MAGTDVAPPEHDLPGMVRQFNEQQDKPFTIRLALPSDYEKAVAKHGDPPVFKKDLNPVFQGIYSSRIELKQWMREIEGLLTAVEKFGAIAKWLGKPADEHALASAWDPVLFNQAHDLASGVMVDKVYDDTKRGYEYARQVGKELLEPYLESIGSQIDTSGEGIPVAVFNTLGWQRNDYVEVQAGFSETGIVDVEVVSPSGEKLPAQLAVSEYYGDGGIRNVRIGFVARGVPALGYAIFRIIPRETDAAGRHALPLEKSRWEGGSAHRDFASIENEAYALTFNLWTGEITKLVHKPANWDVLGGRPANVIAMEPDGGDFWELYGTLNGGRLVAMEKKQGLPEAGSALLSSENVGGSGRVSEGPVYSQFSIDHPFGSGSFATRVRLYKGIERIDIQTRVLNNEKFVRYRAVFPTSVRNGKNVQEIPFGSLERPLGLELPAQNWIDYSDANRGVALLNRGLPGSNVVSDSLVLSLMRSARIGAYGYQGGYEPGVSSDTGFELGKSLTFDYSLMPHAGDWKKAQVYRAGWEFNQPLIARKLASHKGSLPTRWGALEVSHPNVVVSAWKAGPDGSTILRLYEASGEATAGVTVRLEPGVTAAHEANLIEDAGQSLAVADNRIRFDLGPYQIKTFRLQLKPRK
jgi:alpha-mannosidase